ncbi:hypothetical protein [Shewanella sp.]|uniref:hypothetical protein n=1 Tax=Shewanella sp. TaxID=50422 RepID=UPI0040476573
MSYDFEMDMPTPCPHCGVVVDFNDMVRHPSEFKLLVCESCHDAIEAENNQGLAIDNYGNKITWTSSPDEGLLEIDVNGENIATWVYEEVPEDSFSTFMTIWNKAQELTKSSKGGAE